MPDGTPAEPDAVQYVQQPIGRARETVLVVDSYFAGRELLAFGHAVRRPDVALRILTSAQGLTTGDPGSPHSGPEQWLMEVLNQTFSGCSTRPEIRILVWPLSA